MTNRLTNLRASCLNRDKHRCVISGYFDRATAESRKPPVDDSGQPLTAKDLLITEIVHIIPHSLGEVTQDDALL
jgi:hypothetical protein